MGRVEGKVIIVTGAASGLGRADAERFVAEGARVVMTDVDVERGFQAAEEIGSNATFFPQDITDEQSWRKVIGHTVDTYDRLDVLVNNAAINSASPLPDTTLEQWNRIMTVNATGAFLGCKWALPAMEKSGGGSIINMSSVAALVGISSLPAYSASKGAICALTKSIAVYCNERRNRVRCNSVHPDGILTGMLSRLATDRGLDEKSFQENVNRRMGDNLCRPEDVAALVLYLASDESYFVNGAEMCIDNGATHTYPGLRAQ